MNPPEQEQEPTHKLAEIGSYLKKVRQQKGMSLEDISDKTLISVRLLQAIEDCELEELPEPIYVKGHIRRFADTLGVNGTKLADALPMTTMTPASKPIEGLGQLPTANLRPIHLYVLYVLLIVGAVSGLSYLIQQSPFSLGDGSETPSSQPTAEATTQTPVASGSPAAQVSPTPSIASSPQPKPTAKAPLVVHLSLKQESWVRIDVDGKTTFEGILAAGTNKSMGAQEKVVVSAGNAGGVLVAENDNPAKVMGQPGTTAELTFTAKPNSVEPSPSPNATIQSPSPTVATPTPAPNQ